MALDLSVDFADSVSGETSDDAMDDGYKYSVSLNVSECIAAFEGLLGVKHPETFFGYTVTLGFDNYEDYDAYLKNPDREMIENTLRRNIRNENYETLKYEMGRDTNPVYTDTGDAGPDTFTETTLGDFEATLEEIIPTINAAEGLNIARGRVEKDTVSVPGAYCERIEVGPTRIVENDRTVQDIKTNLGL